MRHLINRAFSMNGAKVSRTAEDVAPERRRHVDRGEIERILRSELIDCFPFRAGLAQAAGR